MSNLLLIDDDPTVLSTLESMLQGAGHCVVTASSGKQGIALLESRPVNMVLSELRMQDSSAFDVLRYLRRVHTEIPCIVMTACGSTRDAVEAMRLGAADFLEKPITEDPLLHTIERAIIRADHQRPTGIVPDNEGAQVAHAAARWARSLVPIIDAPADPKTIEAWSRLLFVSPGALRNWCRTADMSPRQSLVFGRLLRAVARARGQHRPADLLDVVDLRTLRGLFKLVGLQEQDLPTDIEAFLRRQTLVTDADALTEIHRALEQRQLHSDTSPPDG
jgi:DNA-binding response OmpR family regulator